jgi:glyoxylase-like metal-dependent hydrolase (beta-lactamase superfamily II)
MRIHHLSCGSFCPHGRRLVNGEGRLLEKAHIVCHCLAIETDEGVVLVDTGLGMEDARNPRQLGATFGALMRPQASVETTALAQLEALGFAAGDVRQIVATHLDLDHSGGLPDFPQAEVHVLSAELDAALHPALGDRPRYIGGAHWRHQPRWVRHGDGGERWFGFEGIRILPGIDPEVLLIPLLGHSAGHTGVAIRDGAGWLLHCGDAYFDRREMATPPSCSPMLRLFQNLTASDNRTRKANQERLRELVAAHGDEVRVVCSHDPHELERARAAGGAATTATG